KRPCVMIGTPAFPSSGVMRTSERRMHDRATRVQDLARFRLPPGFRGRSALVVQLWWLVQATLFRLSPQVCYGWRRWLLRLFGARIGQGVLVRPSARITYPW